MKKRLAICLTLVMTMLTFALPVYAIPALPHAFYGDVTINGVPAPDGSSVSAIASEGTTVAVQNPVTTVGGSYGESSPKLLVQGDIPDGATISFYVNGVNTGSTAVYEAGGGPTRMDLAITVVAPPPPAPPAPTIEVDFFGATTSIDIDSSGVVQETVELTSPAGDLTITIPEGTMALGGDGEPLTVLTAEIMETPPPPPEDTAIIGLAYNFGPDGATFDPPLILTFTYDPDSLPEGVSEEDLVIAFYDEEAGEWVSLVCVVDTENNTVTASISHFTTFALICPLPPEEPDTPASFHLSNLAVTPDEVLIGEEVQVSVLVQNTGDLSGTYTLQLEVNGEVVETKEISLAGHGSVTVHFTVTAEVAGVLGVSIDGLTGRFTVTAPPVPPPTKEAVFVTSNLSVTPALVEPGETVTISIQVANRGDEEGSYLVELKIDGVVVQAERVTLAGGASQTVTFTTSQDKAGIYLVDINGLSQSFTVERREVVVPPGPNWPLIGGIIGGVVVVGLLVFFFMRRRAYN